MVRMIFVVGSALFLLFGCEGLDEGFVDVPELDPEGVSTLGPGDVLFNLVPGETVGVSQEAQTLPASALAAEAAPGYGALAEEETTENADTIQTNLFTLSASGDAQPAANVEASEFYEASWGTYFRVTLQRAECMVEPDPASPEAGPARPEDCETNAFVQYAYMVPNDGSATISHETVNQFDYKSPPPWIAGETTSGDIVFGDGSVLRKSSGEIAQLDTPFDDPYLRSMSGNFVVMTEKATFEAAPFDEEAGIFPDYVPMAAKIVDVVTNKSLDVEFLAGIGAVGTDAVLYNTVQVDQGNGTKEQRVPVLYDFKAGATVPISDITELPVGATDPTDPEAQVDGFFRLPGNTVAVSDGLIVHGMVCTPRIARSFTSQGIQPYLCHVDTDGKITLVHSHPVVQYFGGMMIDPANEDVVFLVGWPEGQAGGIVQYERTKGQIGNTSYVVLAESEGLQIAPEAATVRNGKLYYAGTDASGNPFARVYDVATSTSTEMQVDIAMRSIFGVAE